MRNAIRPGCEVDGDASQDRTARCVRTAIHDHICLTGHELAVGIDGALEVNRHRMPRVAGRQVIVARIDQLDRASGLARQERGVELHAGLQL